MKKEKSKFPFGILYLVLCVVGMITVKLIMNTYENGQKLLADNFNKESETQEVNDTPRQESNYRLEIGKTYLLTSPTCMGATKDYLKEFYSYVIDNNTSAMISMALLEQATLMIDGKVSIADLSGRIAKVRVIDDGDRGLMNGYYAYIFTSDLSKNSIKLY